MYAIAKALGVAWERYRNVEVEQTPSSIRIYSDCPGALESFLRFRHTLDKLRRFPNGEELVGPGILAAEELGALNVALELRYVPCHAGIRGNMIANRAANRGTRNCRDAKFKEVDDCL